MNIDLYSIDDDGTETIEIANVTLASCFPDDEGDERPAIEAELEQHGFATYGGGAARRYKFVLRRARAIPIPADQERAWRFISDAQIDLRRQLSKGERRDLLKDNTNWSSDYIAALVEGLVR